MRVRSRWKGDSSGEDFGGGGLGPDVGVGRQGFRATSEATDCRRDGGGPSGSKGFGQKTGDTAGSGRPKSLILDLPKPG